MKYNKIMIVFGTRPEAIKMAPVILELEKRRGIDTIKVSTSQHREMLKQVLDLFDIKPDFDLNIMQQNQTLTQIVEKSMKGFQYVFSKVRPDLILVQGDTTTAFIGALAGFYEGIPVGHVEAGLRTGDIYSPYPEEANRKMISVIGNYHFAPTEGNKKNLLSEGAAPESVIVTGNTVIDALFYILKNKSSNGFAKQIRNKNNKLVLVTAHRRENFGEPIKNICHALLQLSERHKDLEIVYPVHLNSNIQEPVYSILGGKERIHLLKPVDYSELTSLINESVLVLTDSGGIQEEAPALGKPVVVMRTETERPEAVTAGTAVLAGITQKSIFDISHELLTNQKTYERMAKAVNPYGDGKAAKRIVDFITSFD
ncbi:UDP-N-acetylglucosamine 2-epimerase (non-hydrolyzing) [candidate division KSB1 bacterium]|nr:UDP-N-acetylglucosamine 2-epimerase (non-hydrolyzing) [candidate division KSB1 bacterium]